MSSYNQHLDRRHFLTGLAAGAAALAVGGTGRAADRSVIDLEPTANDADWKDLAEQMADALADQARDAMAHAADAQQFALAKPSEFQVAFRGFADALPAAKRKAALEHAAADATAASKRKPKVYRLAALEGVEVKSKESQKTAAARKSPITKPMLTDAFGGDPAEVAKSFAAAPKPAAAAAGAVTKLALQLLDFSVPNRQDPVGKDEVRLGGKTVNVLGEVKKFSTLNLGDFKQGQTKTYNPPKLITTFDLTKKQDYAKTGGAILMAFERDVGGGYEDVIDNAVDVVKDWLKKEIDKAAAQAGQAIGAFIGSPAFGAVLAKVLGKVLGWLLGKFGELIGKWLKDDGFVPVYLPFNVKTPAIWADGATHGPPHTLWVKGNNGRWEWRVRWAKG